MAQSARFLTLQAQVKSLEKHLIPVTRPNGNYTAKEHDHIRSYRLLVHAELETFFEDRAVDIAEKSLKIYLSKGKTNRVLAALMAFSPLSPQTLPSSLNNFSAVDLPDERVKSIVGHFRTAVRRGNHGIKEPDIIGLLLPIGLSQAEFDAALLNTLSSYGSSRGASAHQSRRVQLPIDPVTEVNIVQNLLIEVAKLDLHLQKLRDS